MIKKLVMTFLLIFSCVFFSINSVEAKTVKKTCNYTYIGTLDNNGTSGGGSASRQGGTLVLRIYDDGTQDGEGISNGTFLAEDFGGKDEKILNWGESIDGVPDIKSNNCPDYIGVKANGFARDWYGFSTENLKTEGAKLADTRVINKEIDVFKLDSLEEEEPTYECKYDFYTLTVDTNRKVIELKDNTRAHLGVNVFVADNLSEKWFSVHRESEECPPVLLCRSSKTSANYYIYMDSMDTGDMICDSGTDVCESGDCDKDQSSGCITYNAYLYCAKGTNCGHAEDVNSIEYYYHKIASSSEGTDVGDYYSKAQQQEQKLAALCQSVMAKYTYEDTCVKACVKFESDLAVLKGEYGMSIGDGGGTASCSLSERVVGWIFKIIKWIRYLVPILLILLSILDFIKAIASNSEDEMRKVGAKFVKRLIVAAIIFLLPLMLEFLLGIFNIETKDYCLK